MGAMTSQITSLTIVYSTVYSVADQRKRQSSASLAFVRGIHRGPVNSPHKGPVTRDMLPFDDIIMSHTDFVKCHDDVMPWKRFPCYRPLVRGIHRSLVDSSPNGPITWSLMLSFLLTQTNSWINCWIIGALKRHDVHWDVIVMWHALFNGEKISAVNEAVVHGNDNKLNQQCISNYNHINLPLLCHRLT